MKKQIITIIKTRDNEIFELNIPIITYIAERDKRISLWKKTIFLKDFNYDLTITNVLSAKQRTKYIEPTIKAPKTLLWMGNNEIIELKEKNPNKYWIMVSEEKAAKAKIAPIIKEQLENWKERRKQFFIKNRALQLKKLAATERIFWVKTTEQKLIEREKFTRAKQIEEFKNLKK